MPVITFTKTDKKILLDRLKGVPDALTECMRDTYEDAGWHWSCRYAERGIEDAVAFVEKGGGDPASLDRHARWCLVDAYEGSTWDARIRNAFAEGETTPRSYHYQMQTFEALGNRMARAGLFDDPEILEVTSHA
jgi:hypothetical protein